jgi:hypothetical protein
MTMLPSIHDHSLIEYRVNLSDRQVTLITLPEEARSRPGIDPVVTVFEGLEGHHFERVSSGVIFLDISELLLSEFLLEREAELAEGHRLVGAPGWWQGTVSAAEAYLNSRGARAFEIDSSYGFSGWVLAASVRQSRLGGSPV